MKRNFKKFFATLLSVSMVMNMFNMTAFADEETETHKHTKDCYEKTLVCEEEKTLICSLEEHEHDSDCRHVHGDACYDLICSYSDNELICDKTEGELECDLEGCIKNHDCNAEPLTASDSDTIDTECEFHEHSDACYYSHSADCYHSHTDSCYGGDAACGIDTEEILCEQEEHEHTDACYEEHEHDDDCYEKELICDEEFNLGMIFSLMPRGNGASDSNTVATIGDDEFETLKEAIAAANEDADETTIVLQKDFEFAEKLTIKTDIIIEGNGCTITRADDYTGTFLAVNKNVELTLDDGLVLDGGNEWEFNEDLYLEDLRAMISIPKADAEKYFDVEDGAPVAKEFMITTAGTLNLNDVIIQNNYSINFGIVSTTTAGATVNLTDAQILHNACTQNSGLAVNASGAGIVINMNEGTIIDGNHVGGNHGIFKIYSGAVLNMYGGEVTNTTAWNSNGVVVGMYGGTFNMENGIICSNSSVYGPNNGRNAAIYLHSNSKMAMNGGTICCNEGRSRGGIDSSKSSSVLKITDGTVIDNISNAGNTNHDVGGVIGTWNVSGGIYTQDLDKNGEFNPDPNTETNFLEAGYACIPYDESDRPDELFIVVPEYKVSYYAVGDASKELINSEILPLDGNRAAEVDLFAAEYYPEDTENERKITKWYTDIEMTEEYSFETEVLQNVKLYGVWESTSEGGNTDDNEGNVNDGNTGDSEGDVNDGNTGDNEGDVNDGNIGDSEGDVNNGNTGSSDDGRDDDDNDNSSNESTVNSVVEIEEQEVPLAAADTIEISENDVPLSDGAVLNIEDMQIPLAVLPMTGDVSAIWMLISLISGIGLAGVSLADRRKRR